MPAIVLTLLPVILQVLSRVADDTNLFSDKEIEKILKIASGALSAVPEAIEAFTKLKAALGGKQPSVDDLRGLAATIADQSEIIQELASKAQQ